MTTPTVNHSPALRADGSPVTLDALASLSSRDLERCFAASCACTPAQVAGDPVGRVLAVRGLQAPPLAAIRRWVARTPLILWEGKSFRARERGVAGFGGNRVRVGWRGIVWRFTTQQGPSIVDGEPCLQIDYDVPENPPPARRIYDELREVAPGLYLGRGGIRIRQRTHLLLWFAVDTTRQAPAIEVAEPSAQR